MSSGPLMQWPVRAGINLSRNDVTAAIPLKFDPYKPRLADSHDDDNRHCLSGINATDRGAQAKLAFILLRCAQAIFSAVACVKTPRCLNYLTQGRNRCKNAWRRVQNVLKSTHFFTLLCAFLVTRNQLCTWILGPMPTGKRF